LATCSRIAYGTLLHAQISAEPSAAVLTTHECGSM
jgi:hypothetical protein